MPWRRPLVPASGGLGGLDLVVGQEEAAVPDTDEQQHGQRQQQRFAGQGEDGDAEPGGGDPAKEYSPAVDAGLPGHRRVIGVLGRHPDSEGHGGTGDRGQHEAEYEHQC
jgi:hypothetical protein